MKKKGSMVTAQDDDGVPVVSQAHLIPQMFQCSPLDPLRRYPQRMRTRPVRLDDYIRG